MDAPIYKSDKQFESEQDIIQFLVHGHVEMLETAMAFYSSGFSPGEKKVNDDGRPRVPATVACSLAFGVGVTEILIEGLGWKTVKEMGNNIEGVRWGLEMIKIAGR